MEPYTPLFSYTFDEWTECMTHLLEGDGECTIESTLAYFHQLYKNHAEAEWKGRRLFYALWRMQEMVDDHPAMFAEFHSPGQVRLISGHLQTAFYRLYSAMPDQLVDEKPSEKIILQFAQESKNLTEGPKSRWEE